MNSIEDIWDRGNEQISNDDTVSGDYIVKSISESSKSISSKLLKIIWFGIVSSLLGAAMLGYNLFFYLNNNAILSLIIGLFVVSFSIIWYLIVQYKIIKRIDVRCPDLKELLVYKLKYLNTKFQIALHCIAFSIVVATFTINLTIENSDGIFEFRKILILSLFYIFVYVSNLFIYKTIHKVYIKQLENALFNLEKKSLKSFSKELKKQKRMNRIIGIIALIILLIGVVFLLAF